MRVSADQGQNVTRIPSERLKPAPPAVGLRYQYWKNRTSPDWMPAYAVEPKSCAWLTTPATA